LEWLGRKANRRGIVAMEYDRLEDRIYREVGIRHPREVLGYLIPYYIEKAYEGEPIRFRILVKCGCQNFSREDCSAPPAAGGRGTSLAAKPLGTRPEPSGASEAESRRGEASQANKTITSFFTTPPSRKKWPPDVELARDYFPQLLLQHGHTRFTSWTNVPAFSRNLRQWHDRDGIDYPMIRLMMEEFAHHPEWCRRSKNMPWKVFLARRTQLTEILLVQQRKDPANRRFSNGDSGEGSYWNRRPTSVASLAL